MRHITGGSVQTVNSGDIRVEASDTSAIEATTDLSVQAKTSNVSFAPAGVTGGVSIAFNAIGWEFADWGLKTIDTLLTTELGDLPNRCRSRRTSAMRRSARPTILSCPPPLRPN